MLLLQEEQSCDYEGIGMEGCYGNNDLHADAVTFHSLNELGLVVWLVN